jgi:hypothetical protein
MIYTKLSPIDLNCSTAEMLLGIPNIIEYAKLNLADRQFPAFTEAVMDIGFFTDTLFIAPTLNNEKEHVLGVYLWENDEIAYIGMYFYETTDEYNKDSILWICFEEPQIA